MPLVNRRDPGALPPPLAPSEANKGLLNLITRGFIPNGVDLTPAFVRAPAPVLCGPSRLHPWEEQFYKGTVAVSPSQVTHERAHMYLYVKGHPALLIG